MFFPSTMPVTLPFPFSFYGTTYTTAHVSTNGNINFVGPNASFTNVCLPSAGAIRGMIAGLWDDLLVGVSGAGRVWTTTEGSAPDRRFIIEWREVTFYGGPGTVTLEIILEEATGSITVQYNRTEGNGDGRSATIGIQNQLGTVGSQYSCNEAAVSAGRAIRYFLVP